MQSRKSRCESANDFSLKSQTMREGKSYLKQTRAQELREKARNREISEDSIQIFSKKTVCKDNKLAINQSSDYDLNHNYPPKSKTNTKRISFCGSASDLNNTNTCKDKNASNIKGKGPLNFRKVDRKNHPKTGNSKSSNNKSSRKVRQGKVVHKNSTIKAEKLRK